MQLSYWEIKNWFTNVDFTIVGSGIVGLHAALALRERFSSAKILVLEKVFYPKEPVQKTLVLLVLTVYPKS